MHGLPVAIDALTAMTKEPQVGRSVSFAAGQVLLYLIDEDDLFAERELGAIGLLDDTYLVHACIAAVRSAFPQIAAPPATSRPMLIPLPPCALAPGRRDGSPGSNLRKPRPRCRGAVFGNGQGAPPPSAERPGLRVEEALSAVSDDGEAQI